MDSLKKGADGAFEMADDGKMESCLNDEFLELKHLHVPVYVRDNSGTLTVRGQVDFYVRPLTDPERSKLNQKASTGDMVVRYEATPQALETYCKTKFPDGSVTPDKLTGAQIAEAGRTYGPQGWTGNVDVAKFNAHLIFYALGGERVIGKGELGVGREGWTLTDMEGKPVPLSLAAIESRLNTRVKNALVELITKFDGTEVSEAAAKN
jgi:hypothetical protein